MTEGSEDILTWTRDTIAKHEQAAHIAAEVDPSPWTADARDEGDTNQHPGGHGYGVIQAANGTDLWDCGSSAHAMAAATSRYVALNDPETVLRRCDADQKLLELHGGRGHACPAYDCDGDLDEWARFYDHEVCPVVQNLAEGYGWTTDRQ